MLFQLQAVSADHLKPVISDIDQDVSEKQLFQCRRYVLCCPDSLVCCRQRRLLFFVYAKCISLSCFRDVITIPPIC